MLPKALAIALQADAVQKIDGGDMQVNVGLSLNDIDGFRQIVHGLPGEDGGGIGNGAVGVKGGIAGIGQGGAPQREENRGESQGQGGDRYRQPFEKTAHHGCPPSSDRGIMPKAMASLPVSEDRSRWLKARTCVL